MKNIPSSVWFLGSLLVGALFIGILVISADNQIRENINLPINITEYFDYQCPHCVDFHPVALELEERFGEDIEFTPKHYPIPVGESSVILAYGAEAARNQEMFTEYHNEVMSRMEQYLTGSLDISQVDPFLVAEALELDLEQFTTDIESEAVVAKVDADRKEGSEMGVTGTPTVFVEGQRTNSSDLFETVERLIEIAKQKDA